MDIKDLTGNKKEEIFYKTLVAEPEQIREIHQPEVFSKRFLKFLNFLVVFVFIVIFIMGGYLLYMVNKDKFKSEINQPINIENKMNQTNQYNFNPSINPSTQNDYTIQNFNNYTIINNNYCLNNS